MTEEENKAIQILDNDNWEYLEFMDEDEEYEKLKKSIEIIVKLAKKQQKENEELKEKVFKRDKELIRLEEYANKNFERKDDVKANYIPKDKIREIVKKLQSYSDIAEQQINQSTIIADSDSLNYGRKEAHITDIRLLKELLEEG